MRFDFLPSEVRRLVFYWKRRLHFNDRRERLESLLSFPALLACNFITSFDGDIRFADRRYVFELLNETVQIFWAISFFRYRNQFVDRNVVWVMSSIDMEMNSVQDGSEIFHHLFWFHDSS